MLAEFSALLHNGPAEARVRDRDGQRMLRTAVDSGAMIFTALGVVSLACRLVYPLSSTVVDVSGVMMGSAATMPGLADSPQIDAAHCETALLSVMNASGSARADATRHRGARLVAPAEVQETSIRCRLDELLTERGLTLTRLSELVGVSIVNLSALKNDRARAIRFSTLQAICQALDC